MCHWKHGWVWSRNSKDCLIFLLWINAWQSNDKTHIMLQRLWFHNALRKNALVLVNLPSVSDEEYADRENCWHSPSKHHITTKMTHGNFIFVVVYIMIGSRNMKWHVIKKPWSMVNNIYTRMQINLLTHRRACAKLLSQSSCHTTS